MIFATGVTKDRLLVFGTLCRNKGAVRDKLLFFVAFPRDYAPAQGHNPAASTDLNRLPAARLIRSDLATAAALYIHPEGRAGAPIGVQDQGDKE